MHWLHSQKLLQIYSKRKGLHGTGTKDNSYKTHLATFSTLFKEVEEKRFKNKSLHKFRNSIRTTGMKWKEHMMYKRPNLQKHTCVQLQSDISQKLSLNTYVDIINILQDWWFNKLKSYEKSLCESIWDVKNSSTDLSRYLCIYLRNKFITLSFFTIPYILGQVFNYFFLF